MSAIRMNNMYNQMNTNDDNISKINNIMTKSNCCVIT